MDNLCYHTPTGCPSSDCTNTVGWGSSLIFEGSTTVWLCAMLLAGFTVATWLTTWKVFCRTKPQRESLSAVAPLPRFHVPTFQIPLHWP